MDQDLDGISISQLNGLIKQKRNDEIKTILLKDASWNLIDKRESTVIHTAVMFDNVDVIVYFYTFGFDINARNSTGQTPILLAAKNNFFRAVQLLLTLDADVFISDENGQNTLQVLLEKERNVPNLCIGILIERLKRGGFSSDYLGKELIEAGYPLEHVFVFNDAELTRGMLKRTFKITKDTSLALLTCAMTSGNIENVRVVLHHGQDKRNRQLMFMKLLRENISDLSMKPFIQQLFNWNLVIDNEFFSCLEMTLRSANRDVVQMYLDIGAEKYCREKFKWELLVGLCANKNVDVIEILKNREFSVNGRNNKLECALHVAASSGNKKLITYLLDSGANPNIRNSNGETPIFYARKQYKIGELLLEAGADLQVLNNNGESAQKKKFG